MDERGFIQRLKKHKLVAIDTSPFIYHLEGHPRYSGLTARLFEEIQRGAPKAVTSTLTLMEVLVRPKELRDDQAVDDYRFALTTFPNLALRPIDEGSAEHASDLRARYGIRPADALQIGTALSNKATGFITNDTKLNKIREIDLLILEKFT